MSTRARLASGHRQRLLPESDDDRPRLPAAISTIRPTDRCSAHLTPVNSSINEITLQPAQTANVALDSTNGLAESNLPPRRPGNSIPSSGPDAATGEDRDVPPVGDALLGTLNMRSFSKTPLPIIPHPSGSDHPNRPPETKPS
jgi:hypothetical protein